MKTRAALGKSWGYQPTYLGHFAGETLLTPLPFLNYHALQMNVCLFFISPDNGYDH